MHPRLPGLHRAIDSLLLILSCELKFSVCRHVSIWGFQNPACLYPEWKSDHCFGNICPALVIDTSMERFSRVPYYNMETHKFDFFFQKSSKMNFDLCWIDLSFVNISPTLVIDKSIERSSRVLYNELILCTLIGAIMLSINIYVGLNFSFVNTCYSVST